MFLDEARLSATLTHPHITQVYDVGADGDAPFFAMEYVHGANLRELMRAHAEAPAEARRCRSSWHAIGIVAAAAAGLHYAHEKRGPGGGRSTSSIATSRRRTCSSPTTAP